MGDWIDDVARAMASGVSRRGMLRGVGAGLAGLMLTSLAPAKAAEAKKGKGKNKNGRNETDAQTQSGANTATGELTETETNTNTGAGENTATGDLTQTNTNTGAGTNTGTDTNGQGGGNSVCDAWCHQNFSGRAAGKCTSAAAKGQGPCFECGPRAGDDRNSQLCNGRCVTCPDGQAPDPNQSCRCAQAQDECATNADCEAPRAVCRNGVCQRCPAENPCFDPATGQCVAVGNCSTGVCNQDQGICGRCTAPGGGFACPSETPCCDPVSGSCVQVGNCSTGVCNSNLRVCGPCTGNAGTTGNFPCPQAAPVCRNGVCSAA